MWRAHPGEVSPLTISSTTHGTWDPLFQPLVDVFHHNVASGLEVGAALCVIVDGNTVVDVAGGHQSPGGDPWTPETLVNAFSVGKGVTAALAASCVATKAIAWDSRVADVWPEFAAYGKESTTLTDLLGHRAGLPGIRRLLPDPTMLEWDAMCEILAAERPWWSPGSEHGYHVNTFGFLVGETLQRATGTPFGKLFQRHISEPFASDVHIGVPTGEHHRIADLIWNDAPSRHGVTPPEGSDDEILQHRAYANPPGLSGVGWVNTPQWRSALMPSTNMHATARGVAAIFAGLSLPNGPVPRSVLDEATEEVSDGTDHVLGRRTRFGRGFQLPIPERSFGPSSNAFGHFGAGGSLGFSDPDRRLGFGYVMNKMGSGWQNERNSALVTALYASIT